LGAAESEERQEQRERACRQDDGPDQGVGDDRIVDPLGGDCPSLVLEHRPLLVEMPALGIEPLLQSLLRFDQPGDFAVLLRLARRGLL
jgi:hypothetical protein